MALQDSSVWTQTEAEFMSTCGGNTRSRTLYEAYIPDVWQKRRPNASSSLKDRVVFCKAKYEALAFVMPPPGPLSMPAWQAILERNETAKRYKSAGLMNIHSLAPAITSSESNSLDSSRITGGVMPNRLIDFFCMVTNSLQLHPEQLGKDLSKLSSPEDIVLWPHVADCYPVQGSYSDMIFPEHLPSFVLPHGCRPTLSQPAPTFFTFVLTQGDGDRIYGGALQIYDEHMEMEDLKTLFVTSGYEGDLPSFLDEPEIVFRPKCLILLSHYPFFDLFRESLLQLYRISLLQAPLPIERYVANLVSEIPLPPRGKVRVEFGFTSSRLISIERPPPNELPLANFSYRPLFASLSTGNIMVVLGCLMEECKVVLLSSQCSILTPVAEALMSAIFPFEWQGLYIPVLPYSITDILEAPVPFLVGLDSRYFKETTPRRRPRNVVFVDLDRDVVHLGVDELTDTNRKVPRLPPHDAQKLKASLDHSGGTVYLLPRSGIKGCIMEGHEELLLIPNEERPKYAHMQSVMIDEGSMCRESVLARARKAYDEHHLLKSVLGFRAVDGQLRAQDGHESDDSSTGTSKMHRRRRPPRFTRNKQAEMLVNSIEASGQAHLLDLNDPEGFSPAAIRKAFLRFMAATFSNYGKCITSGSNSVLFDERRFLRDLGEDVESTSFVGRVLKTQMFQRFLEERVEDPENTEIRFFDESILAKLNRSKVSKMQKGGKFATPFLDDESGRVSSSTCATNSGYFCSC
jgi:DENN domain-containing protein 5